MAARVIQALDVHRLPVRWQPEVWHPVIRLRRRRLAGSSTSLVRHVCHIPNPSIMKTVSRPRLEAGFTLVELLTVIAIIGILAGMILPTLGIAKVKAQVARAKQEMQTIVTAINQYNASNSRMPASKRAYESVRPDTCPDFTYGTAQRSGTSVNPPLWDIRGGPLPGIGNVGGSGYQANNSELVAILNDIERASDGTATVNLNHALNPKREKFLDGFKFVDYQRAPGPGRPQPIYRPGGIGPDLVLRDPWGSPFIISVDLNFDNKVRDGFYRQAAVSAMSGDVGYNGLRLADPRDPSSYEFTGTAMVWSLGPDRAANGSLKANAGVNKDNVLSWK